MSESAIKVDRLVKRYGEITAVDGISFEVHEGEIFGMVGPNGAGKTTTIECIEGLRVPDRGKITRLEPGSAAKRPPSQSRCSPRPCAWSAACFP